MSKPKLTKPGKHDLPWMVAVCTPETTAVSFHEYLAIDGEGGPAEKTAGAALEVPRTSVYIAAIELHGNTGRRQHEDTVLVPVRVDAELRSAIARHCRVRGRAELVRFLGALLEADLDQIRSEDLVAKPVKQVTP